MAKTTDLSKSVYQLVQQHQELIEIKEQQAKIANPQAYKMERTAELIRIPGHPLHTFTRENEALKRLLIQAQSADGTYTDINLAKIREIAIHYAKKGDLLYPAESPLQRHWPCRCHVDCRRRDP